LTGVPARLDYCQSTEVTMSQELPGLIKLELEVGGVPVSLGASLDSDGWRKACAVGGFNRVSLLGKLMLSGGFAAGEAYAARNQELLLFGGEVMTAPDLVGGPLTYSTSASAFFRRGSLYRLVVRVKGDKKAASIFARRCTRALKDVSGDPILRTSSGAPVWRGGGDRLTLLCTRADACLVHELVAG